MVRHLPNFNKPEINATSDNKKTSDEKAKVKKKLLKENTIHKYSY